MAEINAKDVMALRNATGLGMMDCKQALQETKGDVAAAEEWLRKKLKGKMDSRVARAAGEGRIAVAVSNDGRNATIVELRAETDFTAKNESFVKTAQEVAGLALKEHAGAISASPAITQTVDKIRMTTGENISFARGHKLEGGGGTMFGQYIHHDGKTGVLIQAEGSISEDTLRQICMHIAAAVPRPQGISAADVPAHVVDKERKFRIEQAMESGKPKEIAEKMVEGGMRKFFEEIALLEQPFVVDPNKKIKDIVGKNASVTAFFRWQIGETN